MIVSLFRLMRLHYSLTLSLGLLVILSYVTAGRLEPIAIPAAAACLSLFCILCAGYVFNDLCDIPIDRINAPGRILPSGKVPRQAAVCAAAILFLAGLVLSFMVTPAFAAMLALVVVLLTVYNLFSKRMGILKAPLVALLSVSLYPMAFTIAPPVSSPRLSSLAVFPVWFFLTSLAYEMFKDIRDTRGDMQITGKALPNLSGRPGYIRLARLLLILAAVPALLPWRLGYCHWLYLLSALCAVALTIPAVKAPPVTAIRCIYAQVILITAGSLIDLLIFGP